MIRTTTTRSLLRAPAAAAILAFTGSQSASAQSLIYGIGDATAYPNGSPHTLFSFNGNAPCTTTTGDVVKTTTGCVVTSVAFQPSTGPLYGFRYNASSQQGQLVMINRSTAAVMPVGMATTIGPIGGSEG